MLQVIFIKVSAQHHGHFVHGRCRESYTGLSGECVHHETPFKVFVPQLHMGLLIGKRGSTLSNIKKTSGAKVDIDDKEKVLWLGGSEREMEKAVRMIREVMSGKGGVRGSYVCCKAQLGANARGCVSRTGHVTDANFMDSKDLVTTTEMDRPGKVFALDCEMVKSARGGELARVTILDFSGNMTPW